MNVRVHYLPELVSPRDLAQSTVIVIDVLRASTTIAQALDAGVREVVPCEHVKQVRELAAATKRDAILLGGERDGRKIAGFDLGNSPGEYTATRVAGKTLLFTTTNGTKAMLRCNQARTVLIGAPINRAAVCAAVQGDASCHILCAGTHGRITREDVLGAGAFVERLLEIQSGSDVDDCARLSLAAWNEVLSRRGGQEDEIPRRLASELERTQGGRNLLAINHGHDLVSAAKLDQLDVVPQLDLAAWRIRLPISGQ